MLYFLATAIGGRDLRNKTARGQGRPELLENGSVPTARKHVQVLKRVIQVNSNNAETKFVSHVQRSRNGLAQCVQLLQCRATAILVIFHYDLPPTLSRLTFAKNP